MLPRSQPGGAFAIRILEILAHPDRIEALHGADAEVPGELPRHLEHPRKRLDALRAKKGGYVSPFDF